MEANIEQHRSFARNASLHRAEIVVFPEGATGFTFARQGRSGMAPYCVTVPRDLPAPLASLDGPLAELGRVALGSSLVLVTSLCVAVPCEGGPPSCPSNGQMQYNSLAAFDERGSLLAVYHKSHLFGTGGAGGWFDQPAAPSAVSFTTAPPSPLAGRRFGLLVCYDIEFHQPAADLLAGGVRDIVYATEWINVVQQGFARASGAALLAAGNGFYPWSGGSGIYSRRGAEPLAQFFSTDLGVVNRMVVADVGEDEDEDEGGDERRAAVAPAEAPPLPSDGDLGTPCEVFQLLYPSPPRVPTAGRCALFGTGGGAAAAGNLTAVHGSRKCVLEYELVPGSADETWALMARDGVVSFPGTPTAIRVQACQLLRCEDGGAGTAGKRQCKPVWESRTLFTRARVFTSPFPASLAVLPLASVGRAAAAPAAAVSVSGSPPSDVEFTGTATAPRLYMVGLYAVDKAAHGHYNGFITRELLSAAVPS